MKTIRTLLLCAVAASILAGCGGNSTDSELKRQLEEEKANAHKYKCARAKKHGWKVDDCPQESGTSQSN
ncbi:hypothetical protein ACLD9W_09735 [Neisseria sp. WLZKY-1]|uniref:hypothetical protein n=1 Tax=Neisseria sp. WLZKY-1 TaxID=3390377 RepID=UPI0039793806